jgi:hypothetical protein
VNLDKYKNNVDSIREGMKAWRVEEGRLIKLFEQDLAEEYGVADNPKRSKLFDTAWQLGHSNGLHDVACHYDELVELIK